MFLLASYMGMVLAVFLIMVTTALSLSWLLR